MKRISLQDLEKRFDFLVKDYGLRKSSCHDVDLMDVIWVEYSNSDGLIIRVIRERGYYSLKMKIDEEYIELPFLVKFLNSTEKIQKDYKGYDGLVSLSNDSVKYISTIISNRMRLTKPEIYQYYRENKVGKIDWQLP
jgi:hypothetical protein